MFFCSKSNDVDKLKHRSHVYNECIPYDLVELTEFPQDWLESCLKFSYSHCTMLDSTSWLSKFTDCKAVGKSNCETILILF